MQVSVVLADAFRFTTFDEKTNTFKVDGDLTNVTDIGDYPIQVTAKFFNATF